jgi:hypothetical protein
MRMNRGLLFWGLGFLTAGIVALAIQQNYLDRDTMAGAWRLWPLILVALGVALIVSRTPFAWVGTILAALVVGSIVGTVIAVGPGIAMSCGSGADPTALQTQTGSFGDRASLDWQLNCGTLDVSMAGGSGWTTSVGSSRGDIPKVEGSADSLRITSSDNEANFLDRGRERWDVKLPSATTYSSDIRVNAAKVTMDLAGGTFSSFSMQPNAADVRLRLADASIKGLDLELNAGSTLISTSNGTSLDGQIQVNAGSVKLCTADGAAFKITASGTAFGVNVNGSGLAQVGDTWTSATYDGATNKITLTVHGNAGSFDLNPSGGCQ